MKWQRLLMLWIIFVALGSLTSFHGVFADDNETKAMAQLTQLDDAVQVFYGVTETYPVLLDHLIQGPEDSKENWKPLITKEALNDPWGIPYIITLFDETEAAETGLSYQLSSAGPDKEFGTEDDLFYPVSEASEDEKVGEDTGDDTEEE